MSDLLGNTGTPATSAGTGGSFPQSAAPAIGTAASGMTPAQFFAEHHITDATDQRLFVGPDGKLNSNADALASYAAMTPTDRQAIQGELVTAGLLKQTDATGISNGTTQGAFLNAIGEATAQGQDVGTYLSSVNQGGLGSLQQQITGNISTAQNEINKQSPVSATLENPTTLSAAITNAFDQTLGYAPSSDQVSAFVNAIQGQDVAYAQAGNEANKAQAQADLSQAQSAESALNKLGPDGIDSFLSAYANAIHGGGMAGAGTTQGPVVDQSKGGSTYPTPGTRLPPGTTAGFSNAGTEFFANTMPTGPGKPGTGPQPSGVEGVLANVFARHALTPGTPPGPQPMAPGMATAPAIPAGMGTTALHGGIYALSPALWQEAKALTPSAKNYATAGQAPQAVQQAAVTNLATELYGKTGSWSDVALTMAGGNPGSKSTAGQKATGTNTNIQRFATSVANAVNAQISQIQAQISAPGPAVTTRTTAPDASAEANLAAKNSDPVGYMAANYASFGSLLNQMLAGAPQMYDQSTSDTFTGPPSLAAASTPTTQATV